MESARSTEFSEYRWRRSPVFFLCRRRPLRFGRTMSGEISPALNPPNVTAKSMAEVDRGSMQGQLRGGRPKLELVTVAVAAMATVAADHHGYRERTTTPRPGPMQRKTPVSLCPRSLRGLEPKKAQHLLDRDFSTSPVEVDA